MKRAEKEKLIFSTLINGLVAIVLSILLYVIVGGYNHINPKPTKIMVNFTGQFLVYLGILSAILFYIRRKISLVKYSVASLVLGVALLLLQYSFYNTPYGNYVYYLLMSSSALYIVGSIVYTIRKIRIG